MRAPQDAGVGMETQARGRKRLPLGEFRASKQASGRGCSSERTSAKGTC